MRDQVVLRVAARHVQFRLHQSPSRPVVYLQQNLEQESQLKVSESSHRYALWRLSQEDLTVSVWDKSEYIATLSGAWAKVVTVSVWDKN